MNVIFEAKEKHLKQIRTWLFEESQNKIHQFIYNFNSSNFNNENFACLVDDDDFPIGYIDYLTCGKYAKIQVAVIKNSEKRKGFGRLLLDKLSENLLNKNVVVIELFCVPSSSQNIWKKLGFKEFKERENTDLLCLKNLQHPWLYKTLIPVKPSTKKTKLNSYIELNTEKFKGDFNKIYKWDLTTSCSTIIYPVDNKWEIKYVNDGALIYDGQIKRFKVCEIDFGNFLIIDKL